MHSLRYQGQQDGSVDVFICIEDIVCKRGEKTVHKTWGKTGYFSHKVGHVMFLNIQVLYSCILVTLKYLKSSPMKKKCFSIALSNATTLRWISPLLVKISISRSVSLSSYLFCFPWLSCSDGGREKKKSFLWVTLLMQQAWNCKHLVEFPSCELQPTSEYSANIWNSFCASQRPSPSLIEYFYEIRYGAAVIDTGDPTIESINVWDVVTVIQKTNCWIRVNTTCTPIPQVFHLLLAGNTQMRWCSL